MNKVFVDTWAWYALTDAADSSHALAQQTNERLLDDKHTFVTTNFVLDEAITLIRYNMHHAATVRFRQMVQSLIEDGLVELVRVDETHEEAAWDILEQYSDQDFSYTTVPPSP
jgi:predicted nucleic acid-binding protein